MHSLTRSSKHSTSTAINHNAVLLSNNSHIRTDTRKTSNTGVPLLKPNKPQPHMLTVLGVGLESINPQPQTVPVLGISTVNIIKQTTGPTNPQHLGQPGKIRKDTHGNKTTIQQSRIPRLNSQSPPTGISTSQMNRISKV
jgi:hypothetical protein